MTPFAYGNVRLFVAESQMEDALALMKQIEGEKQVYNNPRLSSGVILMAIVAALFVIGLLIALVQFGLSE